MRGRGLALPFIDGHQCSNDRCALCCEFGWGIRFKSMTVMAVTKFERFFRVVAGLHVDKQDLRRYSDFVNQKIYDLLLRGQAAAKANGRDVIEPHDLPITKGLQESIQAFSALDKDIELKAILDHITARPPLHLAIGAETRVQACRHRGRIERGPFPHLQVHRSDHSEPCDRALGTGISDIQPAVVAPP